MNENEPYQPLSEHFFQQPTLMLAQSLLGCLLVKETAEGTTAGIIVETEGYIGPEDRAAHSFGNRRTKRTEIMFRQPGYAYTYGMHTHCRVNVVSGDVEKPEAVLIRALEPYSGIDLMYKRRHVDEITKLTSGPGKLTKAMGIGMEDYGRPLFEPPIYIAEGYKPEQISAGKRIGIANAGEAKDYPWRYWITGNQFVSR